MKFWLLVGFLFMAFTETMHAEMQFPDFESLSKADQQKWGYVISRINGNNPSFRLTISPTSAHYCKDARLYFKNNQGTLLAEINISLGHSTDGSINIGLDLFEALDGNAELIVYTNQIPGALAKTDFGGFTFKVSKNLKK